MRLSRCALALALLAFPACHHPGPPSPAYAHARAQFDQLYADELEDAYLDPQMKQVEEELRTVPANSSDHDDAAALLDRIAKGRVAAEKEQAELQAGVDAALAPPVMPPEAPAEEPDGGAAEQGPAYPVAGMSLTDFQRRFGNCFHPVGHAQIGDGGPVATLYELAESPACQQRFQYFQTRVVVADASKVLGKALKSSYQGPPDAGSPFHTAGTPDAGAATP